MPVAYDKRFSNIMVQWESRKSEATDKPMERQHTMRKFDQTAKSKKSKKKAAKKGEAEDKEDEADAEYKRMRSFMQGPKKSVTE